MRQRTAYILCPFGKDSGLYSGWSERLSIPCRVVDDYRSDWLPPDDAGILISHMHYRWEDCHILRRTMESTAVPVLVLADGIMDFRNTWMNPQLADGTVFQPVFGHKIACIGRAQVRLLESWGNVGKCEVVGLPRLDDKLPVTPTASHIRERPGDSRQAHDSSGDQESGAMAPHCVLIATATTPFFDDHQQATLVQALCDLKRVLAEPTTSARIPVEVIWRLTAGLDQQIGIENSAEEPLADLLRRSDAMISTPSTMMLEAMLQQIPVATLDYLNLPQYLPTAWTINSREQIAATCGELRNPLAAKLLFQSTTLQDQLECRSPAAPRMIELADRMIELGQEARTQRRSLNLPLRILTDPRQGLQPVDDQFQLANLFPDNEAFRDADRTRLQSELSQAIKRLGQLPNELLETREYNRYLAARLDEVRLRLKKRNARVWELRSEVAQLEKELQSREQQRQESDNHHRHQ